MAREKLRYDAWLSVLGTGQQRAFIGLFGTVLGIIRAFHDLAIADPSAKGGASVVGGISGALVATRSASPVAIRGRRLQRLPALAQAALLERGRALTHWQSHLITGCREAESRVVEAHRPIGGPNSPSEEPWQHSRQRRGDDLGHQRDALGRHRPHAAHHLHGDATYIVRGRSR